MKKFSLLLALGLLTGCTSIIQTGDRIERGLTPPDAVNYVTFIIVAFADALSPI